MRRLDLARHTGPGAGAPAGGGSTQMPRMTRTTGIALALALASACGDRRDVDHAFVLGPPHAPTLAEWLAAVTATRVLTDATTFVGTSDPAIVSEVAGTPSQLPDGMLGNLASAGASEPLAALRRLAPDASRLYAPGLPVGASAASSTLPPFEPGCLTATATSLTYDACVTSMAVEGGDSVVTLDGTVQRSAGGVVTWDLVETVTVTGADSEGKRVLELTGELTIGGETAVGQARSTAHTLETTPGRIVTSGWTTFVDVDVSAAPSPFCISGGTIELRRIWTERPFGAPSSWPYVDGAFRFTWSGCGAFVVARSS